MSVQALSHQYMYLFNAVSKRTSIACCAWSQKGKPGVRQLSNALLCWHFVHSAGETLQGSSFAVTCFRACYSTVCDDNLVWSQARSYSGQCNWIL